MADPPKLADLLLKHMEPGRLYRAIDLARDVLGSRARQRDIKADLYDLQEQKRVRKMSTKSNGSDPYWVKVKTPTAETKQHKEEEDDGDEDFTSEMLAAIARDLKVTTPTPAQALRTALETVEAKHETELKNSASRRQEWLLTLATFLDESRLKWRESPAVTAVSSKSLGAGAPADRYKIKGTRVGEYAKCLLCKVPVTDETGWQQHVSGKAHAKNLKWGSLLRA